VCPTFGGRASERCSPGRVPMLSTSEVFRIDGIALVAALHRSTRRARLRSAPDSLEPGSPGPGRSAGCSRGAVIDPDPDVIVIGAGPAGSARPFCCPRRDERRARRAAPVPAQQGVGGCLNAQALATLLAAPASRARAGARRRAARPSAPALPRAPVPHRPACGNWRSRAGVRIRPLPTPPPRRAANGSSKTTPAVESAMGRPAWRRKPARLPARAGGRDEQALARAVVVADGLAPTRLRDCPGFRAACRPRRASASAASGPAGAIGDGARRDSPMAVARHGYAARAVEVESGRVNVAAAMDPGSSSCPAVRPARFT